MTRPTPFCAVTPAATVAAQRTTLAPTVRVCRVSLKALQRIWDMHSEYDAVYNFHHDFPRVRLP